MAEEALKTPNTQKKKADTTTSSVESQLLAIMNDSDLTQEEKNAKMQEILEHSQKTTQDTQKKEIKAENPSIK
jgi:hypothetical protein